MGTDQRRQPQSEQSAEPAPFQSQSKAPPYSASSDYTGPGTVRLAADKCESGLDPKRAKPRSHIFY
jgi:hypothetical protein